MPQLDELLAELANSGVELPDGMIDSILAAAAADAAEVDGINAANVERLNGLIDGANNTIASHEQRIADLMAAAPVVDPDALETFDDPDAPNEDGDDADLDDMFSDSPDEDKDK